MSYQRIKLSDLYTTDEIEDMKTYVSTLSEQEKRHILQYVYRDIVRTILEQFPDISKNILHNRVVHMLLQEFGLGYPLRYIRH